MNYRSEVDGLRALAVLPVILFHAGFEFFSGGFVGVDVFFVISGYLITTIIITEMAEGKFSIINFYERRARRLLPALFFVMTACLPMAWLWLDPNELKEFGQSLVAVSTFTSNIFFWLQSGYFDTAAELKPLIHTWTLAVEEQYYIAAPIYLILTWRFGLKWILISCSIIFILSLGVAQYGASYSSSGAFYLLPSRGWEFLVGVFVAFYLKHNTYLKSHFLNQLLSLLGFCMIVYSIIAFDEKTPFPSFYTLIPVLGTGLLIICAVPRTIIHKLLSLRFFVGIGLISYSAYLWHQPLLAFERQRTLGEISDLMIITLCIASIALAWLSWYFVEKPFRNKNKISRILIFRLSVLGIFIFSFIGLTIHFNNGFLNRFSDEQQEILDYRNYSDVVFSENPCFLEWNQGPEDINEECLNGTNLIWGDSHAATLSFGLNRINNFSEITTSGCPPIINQKFKDRPYCDEINNRVLEYVKKGLFENIYLFGNWSRYELSQINYLLNTIEELLLIDPTLNIKVIGGIPHWIPNLPDILIKQGIPLINNSKSNRLFNKDILRIKTRDNEIIRLLHHQIGSSNIEFVPIIDKLCQDEECIYVYEYCEKVEPITFDESHLTVAGSYLVAKLILNENDQVSSKCYD